MNVDPSHLYVLSAGLFGLGVLGFLLRRNMIIVLASVELMLNAANLAFLAASRSHLGAAAPLAGEPAPYLHGPIFAMFVILVAAAEAAVGLALIIAVYRLKESVSLDAVRELGG